ncbi:hypothetical protein F2Q69_00054584 [Brassica cretica]|uniref:Uncharacterized protein n=1 Tax=Brassica cretica TaxID=69181 RepID=A0A8S9MYS8_BRACR|nr:hypothetical protein F2Q69_00054584 [Brassica cretica]
MEDFLELEEWLEDMDQNSKKKLDDDQHTSRGDLETSPNASIDRHQPDEINRQPPQIIDQRPSNIIDRQSTIVDLEQAEERVHESEASHNADSKHLRPLICAEEGAGLHKIVKRIHDPVKIVVPCVVVEVDFLIPPDKDDVEKGLVEPVWVDTDRIPSNGTTDAISNDINKPASIDATNSSSIDTRRVSEHKEFDVCGNIFDGETTTRLDKSVGKKRRNWKKRKGPREPFAKLRALLIAEMIDKGEESMEEAFTQE